ncbi:hypothetical protein C0993_011814, partial [Termitomyces sp. T159_Od127]
VGVPDAAELADDVDDDQPELHERSTVFSRSAVGQQQPEPVDIQGEFIILIALEYVLIAAFAVIFGGLLIQRYIRQSSYRPPPIDELYSICSYFFLAPSLSTRLVFGRRNRMSLWSSRPNSSSPSTDVPAFPRRFPRTTGLTEVPPYPYSRRTRALDTDAAGRRILDTVNISDHDGYIGDKDVLPAYDISGGPPTYREVAFELNVMHTTQRGDPASANSSGGPRSAGDSHPPARDTDRDSREPYDTREPRGPPPLPGSGQGSADAVRRPESLVVPGAVHVRH